MFFIGGIGSFGSAPLTYRYTHMLGVEIGVGADWGRVQEKKEAVH